MPRIGFQSFLKGFVLLFALTMGTLALRGYIAYRVDHVTQVPMLMRWIDPSLYPHDWFLNSIGHYPIREVFLKIEMLIHAVIPSVPLVLFFQYVLYIAATVGALQAIARRHGEGTLMVCLWLAMIALSNEFANLSKTQMIEEQTVPRMYAYAGVLWAIPLLLDGRCFLAGLLMGLTGLVQGAPPLQMMPIFAAWLLVRNGRALGAQQALMMGLGFLMTFWPNSIILSKVVAGKSDYTADQVIQFSALLRHPHHMLPLEFTQRDYLASIGLLGLLWGWLRTGKIEQHQRSMLHLLMAIVAFLLISPIFIYVFPTALWVQFQSFRVYATFRIVFYFFMALHMKRLLRSGDAPEALRAVLLLLAFWKSPHEPLILGVFIGAEILMMILREKLTPENYRRAQLWVPALALIIWLPEGRTRMLTMEALWWLLLTRPAAYARTSHCFRRMVAWPGLPRLSAAAGAVFLLVLVLWPFKQWEAEPTEWSPLTKAHQWFTNKYQVYPYPEYSLEFAAIWALRNTSPDAIFIIPPDRAKESFQVWSERSTVFNVKTFPYLKSEWPEWIDRYQKMTGVLNPDNKEDVEIVMNDKGTSKIDGWFGSLDAVTLVKLMNLYHADYIISSAEHLLRADELELAAGPFYDLEDRIDEKLRFPLYVFRIPQSQTAAPPES